MGDYFDEKEEENDDDANEEDDDSEEDEDKEKKKFKSEYKDINEIIRARNKINQEVSTIKQDRLERIGRINLELFGDPESREYNSRVMIVQKEMSNPMTQGHPLVTKIIPVIRQIKELQIEYDELNKFYGNNFIEIAELLDNCIMMFRDYKNKFEREEPRTIEQIGQVKDATGLPTCVTENMVQVFMKNEGFQALYNYKKALSENKTQLAGALKGAFTMKVKKCFGYLHPNPTELSQKIRLRYESDIPESYKKSVSLDKLPKPPERNQTQPLPLKESVPEDSNQRLKVSSEETNNKSKPENSNQEEEQKQSEDLSND